MRTFVLTLIVGLLVVGAAHAFEIYVDGVRVPLSGNKLTVRVNNQEPFRVYSNIVGEIIIEVNPPSPVSSPVTPRARRWYGPSAPVGGGKTP